MIQLGGMKKERSVESGTVDITVRTGINKQENKGSCGGGMERGSVPGTVTECAQVQCGVCSLLHWTDERVKVEKCV